MTTHKTDSPRVVVKDVSQRYVTDSGEIVHALADTNLTIEPGEFVSIVGPSGWGKTTLLQMLAGFLKPTEGSILLGDQEVSGPGPDRGVVFQQANLFPWMSVRKNVEIGLKYQKVPAAERAEIAERHLRMVGLEQFMDRKPYELSGGMQQRCQIARVLATNPSIVLMDEPFGALDAMTRERLQNELLAIWRENRKTVFFVTHSVEEAVFLGTRVLVMSARPGRVSLDQPVQIGARYGTDLGAELRSSPEFIELRDTIGSAIYAAQGVTTNGTAVHH